VSHRRLLVLALIAGLPGFAGAQFTTFIPPQHKKADSVKAAVVAQQKAQTDTSIQMQLANMKTWVDSAAGLVPTPTTAVDSANAVVPTTPAATTPVAMPATPMPADTIAMKNGARAPATASALPLLVLLGGVTLMVGVLLLRGAPTPARVKGNGRGRA
jgi:hypothetical protein